MRPSKISKELSGAVAEEQKRQAIDAAKKKAVAQYADYDTFRKMVSVAHLKPIQAPGIQNTKGGYLPAWQLDPNRLASCSRACPSAAYSHGTAQEQHMEHKAHSGPAKGAGALQDCMMPQTSQEFVRDWRRHCPTPEAKYMLLKRCGAEGLSRIFKVEVDGVMLGQMLQVMQQQWVQLATNSVAETPHAHAALQPQQQQQQQIVEEPVQISEHRGMCVGDRADAVAEGQAVTSEAMCVVQMLNSLTGAGRFDLNVQLMDKASKAAAAELCSQLHAVLQQAAARPPVAAGTTEPVDNADISSATAAATTLVLLAAGAAAAAPAV